MSRADINIDLLSRVLAGDATAADRRRVERWLAESPERGEIVAALRAVAGAGGGAGAGAAGAEVEVEVPTPADRLEALLASVKREALSGVAETRGSAHTPGHAPGLKVIPTRRERRPSMRAALGLGAAAAAAVALVIGARTLFRMPSAAQPKSGAAPVVLSTARGQRLALRLPDGTLATLAPNSRLTLPRTFAPRDRTVALEGEAAFTVVHDSTRPFIVHTARATARDLGTRFVVRAYQADTLTEIVVAEGRVMVQGRQAAAAAADHPILSAGQLARLGAAGSIAVRPAGDLDPYFAWTEGRLVFKETPLQDVIARLSRWYDVDVRLVPAGLGAKQVTAAAGEEPAGEVLRMIAVSAGLELSQVGRVYTLTLTRK